MLFFLACLVGCLCACGGGDSAASTESDVTPGVDTDAASNTQGAGGDSAGNNSGQPQEGVIKEFF